jgi:hypothetical protein
MHRRSDHDFEPHQVPTEPEDVHRGLWQYLQSYRPPPRTDYGTGRGSRVHEERYPDPELDPRQHAAAIAFKIMEIGQPQWGNQQLEGQLADRLYRPIIEAAWELVHAGILRPAEPRPGTSYPGAAPVAFVITRHGRDCLATRDPRFPLDSTGQVENLRGAFGGAPDIDLLCSYLSQAIEAYRHDLLLAGATMIGCAYELALVQLATVVVNKWPPGTIPTVTGKLKAAAERHRDGEYAPAGLLTDVVFRSLEANSQLLGTTEWTWVASGFKDTFFLVREMRNEAGHPSGKEIGRDAVFAKIINLGPTYRHVRAIIDLIK